MRKCFPSAAAQIFICKGELRLGPEALTFLTVWQTRVVIPLKDIEDLSIGQFQMWTTPWVMQYERVNFLSVTFSKEGRRQTVHLTPVPAETTSAHQINEQIGGWFEAIQEAVIARTGAAPRVSEPHTVSISAEPAWNRKGVPLTIAFLVALGLVMWRFRSIFSSASEPLAVVVFVIMCVIMWLLLTALLWFAIGFLRANYAIKRGDLHVVTSNEPPENRWLGFSGPSMTPEQSHSVAAAEVQLPHRSWGTRLGFALVILSGLTLLGLALQSWLPSKLRPTLIVTGTVSDAATGLPISGARVADNRYGSEAGRAAQESWSDPNGHFTLKTWPEEHTLAASAPGYERKLATLTSSLWGRERTARMDFQLLPVKSLAVADELAAAVPPVVVSTVPESGVSNVDPALTEIQVTFSKDMMTNRMWAICRVSEDTFPEQAGEIHYLDDRRTCVMPVRLAAGKTYALWFNVDQFDSFRDTQNHPAVPYLLIFETRK
jgi:Carboxypeptidase regulatory-like domain/Bacterial Ig-like domain